MFGGKGTQALKINFNTRPGGPYGTMEFSVPNGKHNDNGNTLPDTDWLIEWLSRQIGVAPGAITILVHYRA